MKKYIALIVAALGFFLLLGTAGACDADAITLGQTIVRGWLAVILMLGGVGAVYILEGREE